MFSIISPFLLKVVFTMIIIAIPVLEETTMCMLSHESIYPENTMESFLSIKLEYFHTHILPEIRGYKDSSLLFIEKISYFN